MTTDMQARDEQEFEAWLDKKVSLLKHDPKSLAWIGAKNYLVEAYISGLAAERERSKGLVEGVEIKLAAIRYHNTQSVFIDQKLNEIQTALKAYRSEG